MTRNINTDLSRAAYRRDRDAEWIAALVTMNLCLWPMLLAVWMVTQ